MLSRRENLAPRRVPAHTLPVPRRGEPERFLTTVLFTDIVGSTEMAAELGDKAWRELVQLHHTLVRSRLGHYGGREMDTAGDGFFAIFDAPASAIACALEIASDVQELGLQIRAGLHAGEVEKAGTKVGGITVPTGARISAQAGPGEVLVSSTVRDLAAGADLRFDDLGVRPLKGIPGEWHLYAVSRVAPEGGAEAVAATPKERAQRRAAAVRRAEARPYWQRHPRTTAAIAAVLVLVVAGGRALRLESVAPAGPRRCRREHGRRDRPRSERDRGPDTGGLAARRDHLRRRRGVGHQHRGWHRFPYRSPDAGRGRHHRRREGADRHRRCQRFDLGRQQR